MLRRTSEWDLLDHCDRPLHPTQQDHEGGSETHLFGEMQIELQELIVGLSVKDIQYNTDEVFSHL